MRNIILVDRYQKFFEGGDSLLTDYDCNYKNEYVKCWIVHHNQYIDVTYHSLFNRYMNDDIFIKWKRDNDIFNIG